MIVAYLLVMASVALTSAGAAGGSSPLGFLLSFTGGVLAVSAVMLAHRVGRTRR